VLGGGDLGFMAAAATERAKLLRGAMVAVRFLLDKIHDLF
jgi:hypothetical protein